MINSPTDAAVALLPCPFCGGAPEIQGSAFSIWIKCIWCGLTGAGYTNESGAIAVWNTRAQAPAVENDARDAAALSGDDKIMWGVVANAGRLSQERKVRWSHVSDATGKGSTSATALCVRFGFDPNQYVGNSEERCESDGPECGPVEFHDSEGVPLCKACRNSLLEDDAAIAASTEGGRAMADYRPCMGCGTCHAVLGDLCCWCWENYADDFVLAEIVQHREGCLHDGSHAGSDCDAVEPGRQPDDRLRHHLLSVDIQVPVVVGLDKRLTAVGASLVVNHVQPRHSKPLALLSSRESAATSAGFQWGDA